MLRKVSVLFVFLLAVSCHSDVVFTSYESIPSAKWHKDSTITFEVSDLDTITPHHLFINVRNHTEYPYSNLFLIATLKYPDGQVHKDTLEYLMAKPDGTFLGKGFGTLKENKLWYKQNIVFPVSGVYTVKINQAMRKNGEVQGLTVLEGITDVGFQIEHTEN